MSKKITKSTPTGFHEEGVLSKIMYRPGFGRIDKERKFNASHVLIKEHRGPRGGEEW